MFTLELYWRCNFRNLRVLSSKDYNRCIIKTIHIVAVPVLCMYYKKWTVQYFEIWNSNTWLW